MTLIELVLALGLASMLVAAVIQLLDSSLSLWQRGEAQRNLLEQGTAVGELLTRDLELLDNTPQGDLLAEWVPFDVDGDGVTETYHPRLRLVRKASRREIDRIRSGLEDTGEVVEDRGLIEVVWSVTPRSRKKDEQAEAVLWRGERILDDRKADSFFARGFFRGGRMPRMGAVEQVSAGLLWFNPLFATQTSIVHDGWDIGDGLEHAATSWDAWNSERPDATWHAWNVPGAGMPKVKGRPLLPRRVRLEYELERPQDRRRRTRLVGPLDTKATSIVVDNGAFLPSGEEPYVKIGAEWMRVMSVSGSRAVVRRGQRGTPPAGHAKGDMVHWGWRGVREVSIALYREDWKL